MQEQPDPRQRQLILIALVLVAMTILAAVVVAVLLFGTDEDPEEPRVVVLPMMPPETATPKRVAVEPAPKPQRDLSTADAGAVDAGRSPGCGKSPPHHLRDTMHPPERELTVFIPSDYDPSVPTPVVFLFHDDNQTSNGFFWDTGIEEVAEKHRFLVAAPRDVGLAGLWSKPSDVLVAEESVRFMESFLCVDRDRVYAIGHGSGGGLVERLVCEFPLRGIATTGYRSQDVIACSDHAPVPYLHFSNLEDRTIPPDGNGCYGAQYPTLEQHEAAWRAHHGCGERRKTHLVRGHHKCWSYECQTPFVSCHLAAGRGWTETDKPRAIDFLGCDGKPPTDFPMAQVTWDFFAANTP